MKAIKAWAIWSKHKIYPAREGHYFMIFPTKKFSNIYKGNYEIVQVEIRPIKKAKRD